MPRLGLQAKSFEPLTRCPQGHRWLRLKTKVPASQRAFLVNRGIQIIAHNEVKSTISLI
jgi:hypothetical protein